jgi:hypothetical protein
MQFMWSEQNWNTCTTVLPNAYAYDKGQARRRAPAYDQQSRLLIERHSSSGVVPNAELSDKLQTQISSSALEEAVAGR